MFDLGVFAYCAAMGFATAAVISTFYQWVTSERADFLIAHKSVPGVFISVLVTMFGGPFIVARKVLAGVRSNELRVLPAFIGAVLAGMWSVCAGVFYVSLLLSS